MTKQTKQTKLQKTETLANNEGQLQEKQEDMHEEEQVVDHSMRWLKRPEWELSFVNGVAVIKGVNDEDLALLCSDDNKGFAKEVTQWVASNNTSSIKITKYQIQGKILNIGLRGPGPESERNPFKARAPKASRGSSEKTSIKYVSQTREITTDDVIAFIFSGRLDSQAFIAALEERRHKREQEIMRLKEELSSFDSWEKLITSGKTIG
jgi:hypothetical protein